MIEVRSTASFRVASSTTPSNQFKRRLLTSSLFTCLDAAALQIVGPSIYRVSADSLAMRAGFAVLVAGLLASLGRMWFLTIRDSSNQYSPDPIDSSWNRKSSRNLQGSQDKKPRRLYMNNLVLNIWVKVQSLLAANEGQDLVEYALVFSVIALGATAGMSSLAGGIDTEFVNISTFIGNYTT